MEKFFTFSDQVSSRLETYKKNIEAILPTYQDILNKVLCFVLSFEV